MLFTDGARGGVAIEAGAAGGDAGRRPWTPIPVEQFVDPVGAGDTFLAGVFAAHVDPSLRPPGLGPDADLLVGAAAASLICEGPGLLGVPARDAVLRRMSAAAR